MKGRNMNQAKMTWVTVCLLAAVVLLGVFGCGGPSKPEIQTVIAQTIQATNMSLLSQVDWKQIATVLEGSIGPDWNVEVEAYIKQSGGILFRGHGGKLAFHTQGQGTGGRDNSPVLEALISIQQRWERADDESRRNRDYWGGQIISALLATRPTTTQPTNGG